MSDTLVLIVLVLGALVLLYGAMTRAMTGLKD
jgi:hypothetical protein